MQRVGLVFRIRPELKNEYKKAHDEIWPEIANAIKDCGLKNYSIFFKKDGILFAYLEIDSDFERQMAKLSELEVNKKWQQHMEKYFVKENKGTLGPQIELLEEVFHID